MFCWETLGPGIYVDSTWHAPAIHALLVTKYTPLMTTLPGGSTDWGTGQRAWGVDLTSKVPRSQSDRQSVGRVGTSLIHGGPGLQKHTPLQPFQCQIPYGTPDRTSGHHALMGQSWFGFTRGTCTSRLVAHLMFERHLSSINQLNSSCHFNFQSDGKIKDSRSLYSHHTGVMSSVFMSLKSGFICLALDPDLKFRPGWPLNRTDLSKGMFFWVPGAM